jgi:hypothetical protein
MKAELQFLYYAGLTAPGYTPRLIHADDNRRCVVLENLEGTAFSDRTKPCPSEIAEAVQFIRLLNERPECARRYITLNAAEGFLGLLDHIANIKDRLKRMSCDGLHRHNKLVAEKLLEYIRLGLNKAEERTEKLLGEGIASDEIDNSLLCVSPSDFGFHNAIRTDAGVKFIDFEYAGWDDPAKMVSDFFAQIAIPIPNKYFEEFVDK